MRDLLVTRLNQVRLADHGNPIDPEELNDNYLGITEDDEAGQDWCEENGNTGYTSYAFLTDGTSPRHPTLAENSLICGL
ncbi:hypothetical protein SAMN05444273_103213 [Litoreibacter ascidiaceicola]|uniref:Uncharacterized protein n=1 Tax=Litoreibacter ascidiaceicola TaxID=1486859 RepID=A0A1M4XLG7_9RHOB|nr:hypothetical protein SAMN05444273_103213 [Litoreibacter ascidiaceicola]